MFHRGIIGLIPNLMLIFFALKIFWKEAFRASGIRSYILLSCRAVLVGNYLINSLLADLQLRYLAVILGLGMAAKGINESSNN